MADPPGLRLQLPGLELDRVESLLILGFGGISVFDSGIKREEQKEAAAW